MKAGEKQAPEQSNVVQAAPFRIPASIEEAYELGWQWHLESFANLRTFGETIEGVTRREGLAHFVSPNGKGVVIPFVATYAFGKPRVPNHPYTGGSVFSVDEDEHECGEDVGTTAEAPKPPRVALWKVECRYKEQTLATFEIRGTREAAMDTAADDFNDEFYYHASEILAESTVVPTPEQQK